MAAARSRDDGDGEKPAFRRWPLDAVRYAVAAVVMVLIVAVFVNAIKVVLRPDSPLVSLAGGSVSVQRFRSPHGKKDDSLSFGFSLHVDSRSGRALMYYYNITVYLFNSSTPATTTSPNDDSIILFNPDDITLPPMEYVDSAIASVPIGYGDPSLPMPFFEVLDKPEGRINDVTMRVDGTLVTSIIMSGYNTTPQPMIYYCRQVIVGVNPGDEASTSTGSQYTSCTTS